MAHGIDPHPFEEGGSRGGLDRYLGPTAKYHSHMPEELVDGEGPAPDQPEDDNMSHEAASPEVAAQRLQEMQRRPADRDASGAP